MTRIITIQSVLHPGQLRVVKNAKRFNVLRMGRRWGKTTLAKDLLSEAIQHPHPSAYYAPSYKDLYDFYENIKATFHPLIKSKSDTVKQLIMVNGAVLDFWSLDNPDSSRGRYYKRVIIDEARKVGKLREAWEHTIRPLLTDLRGDCWFLSTGKGTTHYFHELCQKAITSEDWAYFTEPSWNNPFLSIDEIEQARRQLDPMTFEEEYGGGAMDATNKPFVYSFDEGKHVSEEAIYNPRNFVYLCLDFNVDPFICLLRHHGINHQAKQRYCHFFGEISLKSASVYEMAEAIKVIIPLNVKNKTIRITGDPTAKSRNLVDKGKRNLYQILLDELDLPLTALDLPPITRNYDNRTLCNAMFFSFPELYIHPDCKQLVYDLRYVQADNYGNKVKANRSDPAQRADALDAMGYSFDKYDWEWIK